MGNKTASAIVAVLYFAVFVTISKSVATKESETNIVNSVFSNNTNHFEEQLLMEVPGPRFRLPLSVIPFNYKINMMPILDVVPGTGYQQFTAPGKVWISVDCAEVTRIISIHALNLNINNSTVKVEQKGSSTNIPIGGINYDTEKDFLIIELTSNLQIGQQYEIYIEFLTPLQEERLNGMYLDYYNDPESGVKKYVSTTLFAPYHARRAFPCFDEPDFRATFDITLGRQGRHHSLSNMDLLETTPIENQPGWFWDTFSTTPSISPYIIAMIVSDFNYTEATSGSFGDKPVRVYAAPHLIDRGAGIYSSKLTADVLTYFEEYFIIKYPLPKMFSIALPHFFFNAMENWGLITYKEPVLLFIPDETSEAERYRINYVLSHEIAHQWFGNLVSCKWWAYVWLKEGFATLYAHYGIQHTHPEFQPWSQFVPNVLQVALQFDSTRNTHPLENFPATSAAVADIYTRIPYEKGASILRMTSSFLGESTFKTGIQLYVDRFKFRSAVQNDLFQALQEAVDAAELNSIPTDTNMKAIMDTWTTQSGFPVVRACASDTNSLLLTQEKFILDDPTNIDDTWWIPITIQPKLDPGAEAGLPDVWIPQGVNQISVALDTDQLIIINPEAKGYYRVLYCGTLLNRIQQQLNNDPNLIPIEARSQIIDDYFSLAFAKYTPVENALNMTKYLNLETNFVVWKSVLNHIEQMYLLFSGTEYLNSFQTYFASKLGSAVESIGLKINPEKRGVNILLQSELLRWACLLGNANCQTYIEQLFASWQKNPNAAMIPVDIQLSVYSSAVASRNSETWEFIYQQYLQETSSGHKVRLIKALTKTENIARLIWLLKEVISDSTNIREEDKLTVLNGVASNPAAKLVFLNFIEDNFNTILKWSESEKIIASFISILSSTMNTQEELIELQNFVDKKGTAIYSQTAKLLDAVSTVKSNIAWINTFGESILNWLKFQHI